MTNTLDPNLGSGTPSDADAAELRAYLQRGETRLSTLHRVAGTFLGGAGLLTLLPVLFRDAFSTLLSRILFLENDLFPGRSGFSRSLVLVPVLLSMLLPLWALYLLIRDLVGFYFTAHHFGARQQGITYPRFILSGIRVSHDSLEDASVLDNARRSAAVMDLLVPASSDSRARLLREAQHVGECKGLDVASDPPPLVGHLLQQFVFNYTASNIRTLAEECAKMEASLARHNLLIRGLVLRYAKAFLLVVLTTITTIIAVSILDVANPSAALEFQGRQTVPADGDILWVALMAVYVGWCLAAAWIVRRPIVWIYREIGDRNKSLRTPESLVRFERLTLIGVGMASGAVAHAAWLFAEDRDQSWTYVAAVGISIVTLLTWGYVGNILKSELRIRRFSR